MTPEQKRIFHDIAKSLNEGRCHEDCEFCVERIRREEEAGRQPG